MFSDISLHNLSTKRKGQEYGTMRPINLTSANHFAFHLPWEQPDRAVRLSMRAFKVGIRPFISQLKTMLFPVKIQNLSGSDAALFILSIKLLSSVAFYNRFENASHGVYVDSSYNDFHQSSEFMNTFQMLSSKQR